MTGDSEVVVGVGAGVGVEQQESIFSEAVFTTDKPNFAYTESEAN